jgi:hypothetical protein
MIKPSQKSLPHIYASAARLSDPAYRDQLRHAAGVSSCSDPKFTQSGWENVMAALETVLFMRVHAGEVPNPIGRSRYILTEFYWRHRLPREGMINSRQAYKIQDLWTRLQEYLPEEHRNLVYLGGIIRKSTGKTDPGFTCLTGAEAESLINALKDRFAHALSSRPSLPSVQNVPVPVEEELVPF